MGMESSSINQKAVVIQQTKPQTPTQNGLIWIDTSTSPPSQRIWVDSKGRFVTIGWRLLTDVGPNNTVTIRDLRYAETKFQVEGTLINENVIEVI